MIVPCNKEITYTKQVYEKSCQFKVGQKTGSVWSWIALWAFFNRGEVWPSFPRNLWIAQPRSHGPGEDPRNEC